MLNPDDPVWKELIADIEIETSLTYVKDSDVYARPYYVLREGEWGFTFASMNREDRMEVLAEMVSWRGYESRGIEREQCRVVIANVLDGKPQEKWLEGAFDEAVLENDKTACFKTMVDMRKYSPDNHVFEEMDGGRLPWEELSAAAKLQYIARDAVISDVRFETFAQIVKDTIGEMGEAALQVVLDGQKELHAIATLLPDDGRTEPTLLAKQVKDMLDYVSALEAQEQERRGKAFPSILREDEPGPDRVKPEQGEDVLRDSSVTTGTDRSPVKAEEGKLSLRDLRYESQGQERRGEEQRSQLRDMER